jgi:hypothetical protein
LEIVINDRPTGDILLNPGSTKLPRPMGSNMIYRYSGYMIAPDQKEAEAIFEAPEHKSRSFNGRL